MAQTLQISPDAQNAGVSAIADLIDGGATAGTVEIRTGAHPATTGAADTGTLLATLTFSDPAFAAPVSGTATANAITSDTNVDATGVAGHFRIKDSNGVVVMQGTAGEAADTPDMTFDSKNFIAGGTAAITAMTLTQPDN